MAVRTPAERRASATRAVNQASASMLPFGNGAGERHGVAAAAQPQVADDGRFPHDLPIVGQDGVDPERSCVGTSDCGQHLRSPRSHDVVFAGLNRELHRRSSQGIGGREPVQPRHEVRQVRLGRAERQEEREAAQVQRPHAAQRVLGTGQYRLNGKGTLLHRRDLEPRNPRVGRVPVLPGVVHAPQHRTSALVAEGRPGHRDRPRREEAVRVLLQPRGVDPRVRPQTPEHLDEDRRLVGLHVCLPSRSGRAAQKAGRCCRAIGAVNVADEVHVDDAAPFGSGTEELVRGHVRRVTGVVEGAI